MVKRSNFRIEDRLDIFVHLTIRDQWLTFYRMWRQSKKNLNTKCMFDLAFDRFYLFRKFYTCCINTGVDRLEMPLSERFIRWRKLYTI